MYVPTRINDYSYNTYRIVVLLYAMFTTVQKCCEVNTAARGVAAMTEVHLAIN